MTADTFKFQVPPDWASREEIIGALELWVRRAKSAEAREKELREALRNLHNYLVGMSAYLATCATPTIIENLESTIQSLHIEQRKLDKLLAGEPEKEK
jgi:hypothetical protein